MAQRPSTSSGPPSRRKSPVERSDGDKRRSKDDLTLALRGSPHAPALMPRSGARGLRPYPGMDSHNVYYSSSYSTSSNAVAGSVSVSQTMGSDSMPIGMALGSPSHPPPSWNCDEVSMPSGAGSSRPIAAAMSAPIHSPPPAKRKRRLFGGLFGGKKSTDTDGPSQPRVEAASSATSHGAVFQASTSSPPMPWSAESPPDRSGSAAQRRTPKHQPLIVRSNTEPIGIASSQERGAESRVGGTSSSSNSSRPAFSAAGSSWPLQESSRNPATINYPPPPSIRVAPGPPANGSLLDVEIPSIQMERYSVMFGSLLGTQPASSLLARRQATLDRLKTIQTEASLMEVNELELGKPKLRPRCGTSPQPAKSPGFSLFPPTPKTSSPSPFGSRLPAEHARSNTSPAYLPSPSKATFDEPKRPAKSATHVSSPPPEDAGEVFDAKPLRPALPEPEWEMVTGRPDSPSTVATGFSNHSGSASISTTTTATTSPASSVSSGTTAARNARDAAAEAEAEAALKAAVEISIARQISLSRQQRQLLRPLQTSIASRRARATAGAGDNGATASDSPTLGHIKKGATLAQTQYPVSETRKAVPTLIVPRGGADSQLRHRKSERVIVEAA